MPPMMFVSIDGHAIFQTAAGIGPSTIDLSYRPIGAAGGAGTAAGVVSAVTGVVTPVNARSFRSQLQRTCRIFLDEIGDTLENVGIFFHLLLERRILVADCSKK
jgi:hypothetical protein